jgi:DNA-binding transcriptional LysR family regulator
MDQTDWKIIHLLYEEKNITKTAERMYISQPALTYRIKNIENKLGISLIHRTKQRITFTREGEHVAAHATKMVSQFQKLIDHLEHASDEKEGTIRIGVSSNVARFILPSVLKGFMERYPKVQFHVTTAWSNSILEMAKKEGIHLAIVRGNFLWDQEKILLMKEPISIISTESIRFEQLPELPRIMFKTEPGLQQVIDAWWQQNFFRPPQIAMEIDSIETCTKMVESGLGYAIVPDISLTRQENLKRMPLRDENKEEILRETWLLFPNLSRTFPIVDTFLDFLIHWFQEEKTGN